MRVIGPAPEHARERAVAELEGPAHRVRVSEPGGVALPAVAHPAPVPALGCRAGEQPELVPGKTRLNFLDRSGPRAVAVSEREVLQRPVAVEPAQVGSGVQQKRGLSIPLAANFAQRQDFPATSGVLVASSPSLNSCHVQVRKR